MIQNLFELLFITNNIAIPYCMICYFLQDGYTPIHLASRDGHVEVIDKLICSGADVNVVNKVSVTAVITKCLMCHGEVTIDRP